MIANDFKTTVALCGQLDREACRSEFIHAMNQLHDKIRSRFSASSLLLYQELHRRASCQIPGIPVPSFYEGDFLDTSYQTDPSNFAIAFGFAMKNLHKGNRKRAIQLLNRIANSGYKERRQARQQLQEIENRSPALRDG